MAPELLEEGGQRGRVKGKGREGGRQRVKIQQYNRGLPGHQDQSLSPVTLKQTFLCDAKPWSSLEPMSFGIVAFSNAS